MVIALGELFAALQFLVVLIFDAERAADIVHAPLVRRGIVAARRFVAHGIRIVPSRIWIAGGEGGTAFGVEAALGERFLLAGPGSREHARIAHPGGRFTFGIG